jgi:hypothetical protein
MALSVSLALALTGSAVAGAGPADRFFAALAAHCGKAFEGRLATQDPRDADMAGKVLVMHVRDCAADVIRIPFHVGEDRSRTWVITRTAKGLRLKHDHRHEDGSPDAVTMYGGETASPGRETRQAFPVDEDSKAMFLANNLPASVTNEWAIELVPGEHFVYELSRKDRLFRVEFDLRKPIDEPPPAWGHDGNGALNQP